MSKFKFINLGFFYVTLFVTLVFPALNSASARKTSSKELNSSKILLNNPDLLSDNDGRQISSPNLSEISFQPIKEQETANQLVLVSSNPGESKPNISESKLRLARFISFSFFLLFFIPLGIFYPLFLFYRKLLGVEPKEPAYALGTNYAPQFPEPHDSSIFDVEAQADTQVATVSKLQIAFSPQARRLRRKLEQISSGDDLNLNQDLVDFLCKTILALVSQQDWTHVNYSSVSLPLEEVQTEFDLISYKEKDKFLSKELSLVNRNQPKQGSVDQSIHQDSYRYVVVTLVFCTTHNNPLFNKIHTEEQLIEELGKLGNMKAESLIKFELLWNPQQEDDYLSNEQLLTKYSDMIRLL